VCEQYFADMKGIKVPHLIAIAAACWLVLICIQAKWIVDSRNMIEEQFDQKVSLALGAAVSSLDSSAVQKCIPPAPDMICKPATDSKAEIIEDFDDSSLHKAVDEALAFYDIDMEYTLVVTRESPQSCNTASPYCCSISPFEASNNAMVNIAFPGKNAYLLKKIWWMLAMSVFILLFVLLVFVLALRSLIHQKRISQWNIDFFNNMAHEFKTPLTNISLALQRLIKRTPVLADDPFVNIVRKEEAKLGAQIDRVLGIAALEHGGAYLKKERLDLEELLNVVIRDMQLAIQNARGIVTLSSSESPVWVEGDRFHLIRAFKNLIDNALKYSDDIPKVEIGIHKRGENVVVSFEDNGVGITARDREFIFKKFHRIPNGNRHDQKGFGLGLSYVKMIIEDHQGTIRALRRAQQGTRFELLLPTI